MKVHTLSRSQFLPIPIDVAWSFFSSPNNLKEITPLHMGFHILSITGSEGKMYAGQIICYRVKVLPFIATRWVTEITHVQERFYFVDEQRIGPYALWHHEHRFHEVKGGVEITDEVSYAIPFGILGQLANLLFVRREVNAIFEFRRKKLNQLFSSPGNSEIKKSA
ncbi:MAG TPA: SRPBCC family protein [Cyclobacteriaceae bacterium]|nr:SRPBCC family protein [Cyclobacteriaceae bacterium]